MRWTTGIALVLLLAGSAHAAPSGGQTIGTSGEVAGISADGGRVAIHSTLTGTKDCNSGAVWTPASNAVVHLKNGTCTASDLEYDALTLAGSSVAWVNYDFGNHAYCDGPFTATVTKPTGTSLAKCSEGDSDVYWEFKGDATLLVSRSYTLCEADCEPDFDKTYDATVRIGAVNGKWSLKEADDTKLLDADAGRILLAQGKALLLLDGAGKTVGTVTLGSAPDAGRIAGAAQVAVVKGATLTTYDVATGAVVKTRTLAKGAKLQDVEGGTAVYFASGRVHLLDLASGRDKVVATVVFSNGLGLVQADLEPAGLYYAWNDAKAKGDKPGRVTFIPASALPS